ncbi:MAG: sigma-70 family RNA polymerase sigma factor [Duncaniella sp.]|nr:sigma-70 family RNA polymerase sigma factor [Duncaniella sp.]
MQYSATEFETIYIRYFPPSMKLAMSMLHDEDEARDVVQEVFLKLWETETKIENPVGFILMAVRNTSITRINRLDIRDKICQRLALESPPEDQDPEQRAEEISSAIKLLLTLREQVIIEKIYHDRMSYKETAAYLGVSVATVNKYIVSALRKLRIHFKTGKS